MQKGFLLKFLLYTVQQTLYLHKVLNIYIRHNYCIEMSAVLLILYNGLISLGVNFLHGEALYLAEIFPISKYMIQTFEECM